MEECAFIVRCKDRIIVYGAGTSSSLNDTTFIIVADRPHCTSMWVSNDILLYDAYQETLILHSIYGVNRFGFEAVFRAISNRIFNYL